MADAALSITASPLAALLMTAKTADVSAGSAATQSADPFAALLAVAVAPKATIDTATAQSADPVAALRAWGRACRQGGVVAARDADYEALTWYPHDPQLDRWLELYRQAARTNGGEPDAGRRLFAWAHEAGFEDVTPTASVWCYATADDRAWWAGLWADRMTMSAVGTQLVASGASSVEELHSIADAWRRWAAHPDGWFVVPHGEIIARV